ncbi:unnamed protein product [Sphagnum jensenii]|uniref:Uncharacterized protein n=1 Tax=Sphagnum jensenii TaxID=128206 RepID=A0ABP0XA84_9BRYO
MAAVKKVFLIADTSLESAIAAFNGVDGVYIVVPFLAGGAEDILIENYLKAAKETAAVVLLDTNRGAGHFAKVDPTLEQIIGRKPISLHEVFTENASAFKA